MGLNLGAWRAPQSIVSMTRRIRDAGGEMHLFSAMYSIRISFCKVPPRVFQYAPCFSAAARYIAQMMAAGELMVMEVVISQSGIWSKRISMSARELMATPHWRMVQRRVRYMVG